MWRASIRQTTGSSSSASGRGGWRWARRRWRSPKPWASPSPSSRRSSTENDGWTPWNSGRWLDCTGSAWTGSLRAEAGQSRPARLDRQRHARLSGSGSPGRQPRPPGWFLPAAQTAVFRLRVTLRLRFVQQRQPSNPLAAAEQQVKRRRLTLGRRGEYPQRRSVPLTDPPGENSTKSLV